MNSSSIPAVSRSLGVSSGFRRQGSDQIGFDSALRVVRNNVAATIAVRRGAQSSSQTDRDAQARSEALAAVATRSAGLPINRGISGGGHIDAPLPFGGPSREQRERDSTVNAQTKEILSRIQRRRDSTAAAGKSTDSLARLEDSLRRIEGVSNTLP